MLLFAAAVFGVVAMYKNLGNPPKVTIKGPTTISTSESEIMVAGKTDPKATVSVAGTKVGLDKSGNFSHKVKLSEKTQEIVVRATKWYAEGNAKITVTRSAAVTTSSSTRNQTPATSNVSTVNASGDLSVSGPRENFLAAFGVAAIIMSFYFYRRSVKFHKTALAAPFTMS